MSVNVYPDYTNDSGEAVELLGNEEVDVVRFRYLDGKEDVMAAAAFYSEFKFVGKDHEDDCEHGVHPDEICEVCDVD